MNTEEMMTNEGTVEVIENTAEEVVTAKSGKGLKIAAGVGIGVLVAFAAYKYVAKPALAKWKARKTQDDYDDFDDFDDVEDAEFKEVPKEEPKTETK